MTGGQKNATMFDQKFIIKPAGEEHCQYAETITDEMERSAQARGTGIAKRSPEYIKTKMREGKAVIALTVCYAIELSQLYKAVWIEAIRQTMPGRLVLGSGFLYSDLLAYAIGTAFAFFIDCLLFILFDLKVI